MATTVFCDDAGFTGDNLLQREQPFFGFAAIAIEPDEAADLVRRLRDRFSVVGGELSGRRLYLRLDARELISWLLAELGDRASVAVHDKIFSLSGKFFEYVYEPILARDSRFLYELGFHLHVANVIRAHLERGDVGATRIAQRFEDLLRRRGNAPMPFFETNGIDTQDAISTIARFVNACRPAIEAEMSGLADEAGRVKWVLDLSLSSAQSVLRTMGERFGALDVTFDESKPLEAYRHFFDVLVGRTDNPMFGLRGRERPLIFELERPVRFGVSAEQPGLQLADVVASFSTLASRDRLSARGREIFDLCVKAFNEESVWPDLDHLRLDRKENFLNAVLMSELADRAEAGGDPLVGLREFHEFVSWRYDVDPPPGMGALAGMPD